MKILTGVNYRSDFDICQRLLEAIASRRAASSSSTTAPAQQVRRVSVGPRRTYTHHVIFIWHEKHFMLCLGSSGFDTGLLRLYIYEMRQAEFSRL